MRAALVGCQMKTLDRLFSFFPHEYHPWLDKISMSLLNIHSFIDICILHVQMKHWDVPSFERIWSGSFEALPEKMFRLGDRSGAADNYNCAFLFGEPCIKTSDHSMLCCPELTHCPNCLHGIWPFSDRNDVRFFGPLSHVF
jgi:hypothetical protein